MRLYSLHFFANTVTLKCQMTIFSSPRVHRAKKGLIWIVESTIQIKLQSKDKV